MKKFVWCAVFALALGGTLFSQTWTTRSDDGYEAEHTVITKEEYNRLKRAYETGMPAATVQYTDTLEGMIGTGPVISGQAPKINGYFYQLVKVKKWGKGAERMPNLEPTPMLMYGYTGRGAMGIMFLNERALMILPWCDAVNSASYQRKVREYTALVEGR